MTFFALFSLAFFMAVIWLRPRDYGGAYTAYFNGLNGQLKQVGSGAPRMILDLDCLDHNLELVKSYSDEIKPVRLVVKSLASLPLLDYCMTRLNSGRLMVFDVSFLEQVIKKWPGVHVLLGKPIPIRAMAKVYRGLPGHDLANVVWLVDSLPRFRQISELASELNKNISVAIEIDIGLRRGGVESMVDFAELVRTVKSCNHCQLRGLMGYDPHLAKIPLWLGRARLISKSQGLYQEFVDTLDHEWPEVRGSEFILNGAGSPTFRLHGLESPLNEVSVGSALLKPADFDLPILADFRPALFIASPVLKKGIGPKVPLLEAWKKPWGWWNPNRCQTFFIYGGYWKAVTENPPGMTLNPLYGRSSNQELLSASFKVKLDVDDHVFLKPTQSEAVLGQLGALMTYRKEGILGDWQVMNHLYKNP